MTEDEWVEEVHRLMNLEREKFFVVLRDTMHSVLLSKLRKEKSESMEFRRFMHTCRTHWVRLEKRAPGQEHWLIGNYVKPVDILLKYKSQNGLCFWCSQFLGCNFHVDHYEPLSVSLDNSPVNICLSCAKCNCQKHTKSPEAFVERRKTYG